MTRLHLSINLIIVFWREKKILDFDVSNMPISEFCVRLLETDYFFHSAIEQDYFFSQNQSKEIFFSKKIPSPPPPPLNIKWTVPNWQWRLYQRLRQTRWLRISYRQLSLGLVVMTLYSHRKLFTFRSWLYLLGVVLAFFISILEIFKSLQNYWHR